ncbi:MAG TPA: 2,3-epoxybenzoyl-CoA dihydrolase [Candidatus Limnocylindrales bacterium]|nr:2,3-epoxybenzoyl-CoA dihydrolase [Candidatus Limnocylindrales bacterium]
MSEVGFDTGPDSYRHWRLSIEPPVATLVLKVDEQGGLVPGYELKQNSYDLGVDIELHDAVQRLRFEHPEVRAVVITGGLERMFCAGANIRMLAQSSHPWKVNFCKFTNETRNEIEDACVHSGQTYLAALNGTAAGGGYEIALACERILLVDDNSSAVSLPEVSLLGVLPGTGGLTRVTDKRGVRKDLADVFATKPEGVRGKTALAWGLVDEVVPRARFDEIVRERALQAAARSSRPEGVEGIRLAPLRRSIVDGGLEYEFVSARMDREKRCATITVRGPSGGGGAWLLTMLRELDDVILRLRHNELETGTWLIKTEGDAAAVLACEGGGDWAAREIRLLAKRVFKRLDVTSRSLIALIEPGSCFAGLLLELALACDRQYMLEGAAIVVAEGNFGRYPMGNGLTRLESRFYGQVEQVEVVRGALGRSLESAEAEALGLVTVALDDIDWDDEIRLAVEERAALSPDALTGMEANHRFVGPETVESKVFGRLAAWQNWIFTRPNASGPDGALARYGTGQRAKFDRRRV